MNENCRAIKRELETFFDVPFDVSFRPLYQDQTYIISPHNDLEELFTVKVLFRQKIRMIVEIEPQKYAASMVESLNHADAAKRSMFEMYVAQIKERGAKIDFYINQNMYDDISPVMWEDSWHQIRIRATQIIADTINDVEEIRLVQEWTKLATGLFLSLLDVEGIDELQHAEGKISQVLQTKYERNPVNRELCLDANGYVCKICGFDFEKVYGEIGHNFIHVHHIEKVSSFGGEYYLNPVTDMIPVCPNCHAMLHREDPPISPEKLRGIIKHQITDRGEQ